MRIKNYSTLKSANKIALSKDGDVVSLTEKRFNAATGEALSDVVNEVELSRYENDKANFEAQKAALEVDIAELTKIIADIKAL